MNSRIITGLLGMVLAAGCTGIKSHETANQNSPAAAVYDVPRLDKIVIDGKSDDWGDKGFRVDTLIATDGTLRPASDQDASFRLAWNNEGLLVLITLGDNIWIEAAQDDMLWQRDSVEMFLRGPNPSRDICQWVIAPGMASDHPELRSHFYDFRKDEQLRKLPSVIQTARTRTDKGCIIEALLPWAALDIKPQIGAEAAFQLWVNDSDDRLEGPAYQPSWFPELGAGFFPERMCRIRLAETPSAPVTARAAGSYNLERLQTRIGVVAASGKTVTVSEGGKVLSSTKLAADGRRVQSAITLPLPPIGSTYSPLSVEIDGQAVGEVCLADVRPMRQDLADRLPLIFRPCVFDQQKFPPLEFENPLLAEGLIGPYAFKVRFFDGMFQEVAMAEKTGRYGAIVEIQPASGSPSRRFITLFHSKDPINWRDMKVDGSLILPLQLGIKPEVIVRQLPAINQFLSRKVIDSTLRDADASILLAGLYHADAGAPAVDRTSPYRDNERWWYALKKKTGTMQQYQYAVHVPAEAKNDAARKFPAILILHGSGERGTDLSMVMKNVPYQLAEKRTDFPFIVIAPLCPMREWWKPESVKYLVDEVMAKYPIDPDRLYLTGLSMGGFGSWAVAIEYPDLFAAVVPICGGGDTADIERIKNIPIWIFHGDKDGAVPVKLSDEIFDALKKIGGRVRYSRYPGVDHGSWGPAYNTEDLYKWLLQQKRGQPQQAPATPESAPDTNPPPKIP